MRSEQTNEMLSHYYSHPNVRARLVEFMGGRSLESVTAEFITADDENADVQHRPAPASELWNCLEDHCEVGRSLWDRESLIVDFDVEYVNFDQPGLPFVQPKLCYDLQEPVVVTVERWLLKHGISPLHWISGQGHHFAWKISQRSDAFHHLALMGHVMPLMQDRFQRPSVPNGTKISSELGAAFAGLGIVMEYAAQEIKQCCNSTTETPITLTAIEAGPARKTDMPQREVIALDISEYGDPLDSRGIRMPFSVYLKPSQKRFLLGDPFVDAMPPIFPIPLFEMDTTTALEVMRDSTNVIELAGCASSRIPDYSDQMRGLIGCYKASPLAEFHRSYYAVDHDFRHQWPGTNDPTCLDEFPLCVTLPLQQPNDWLLKPAVIQHVVRTLLAVGWNPASIAGLIQSKYEQDYGWGNRWDRYDAASRADFYVRIFAGAIVTGLDPLVDFNCVSMQEKQFCPPDHCEKNLLHWRDRLVQKLHEQRDCESLRDYH